MFLQCFAMSLPWDKLAYNSNKRMESSLIGYLFLYFSEQVAIHIIFPYLFIFFFLPSSKKEYYL